VVQSQTVSAPLTNQDIVRMIRAGISQETILVLVRSSPSAFQMDPDSVIALKEQGLSDEVIRAMAEAKTEKAKTQPEAVPITVPSVGIFRPGSIFGCVGTVEVSPDRIAWRDTANCWTRDLVEVKLSAIRQISYDDFAMRVSVYVWESTSETPMQLSVTSSGARKLWNYLSDQAPKFLQQCRAVSAIGLADLRPVNCASWAR